MKKHFFILFLLALFTLSEAVIAQTVISQPVAEIRAEQSKALIKAYKLNSKLMAREIPYNIIFPPAYEADKNARFPVLYLLHGLGGSYKNWIEKTALSEYAARHRIIIVNPEGGDGWYTDSSSVPNDKYESYIIEELIPEVDKNFRTIAERNGRAVAGLSMGGYGAIKFGIKHPEKFVFAASMSGAVGAASYQTLEELPRNEWLKKPILATFGEPKSPTRQANDLFKLFSEMPAERLASLPFFYLDCGTEDALILLPSNQMLAALMLQRKIPHEFRQLPGKHNWEFWNQQIQEVLRLSERVFSSSSASK